MLRPQIWIVLIYPGDRCSFLQVYVNILVEAIGEVSYIFNALGNGRHAHAHAHTCTPKCTLSAGTEIYNLNGKGMKLGK